MTLSGKTLSGINAAAQARGALAAAAVLYLAGAIPAQFTPCDTCSAGCPSMCTQTREDPKPTPNRPLAPAPKPAYLEAYEKGLSWYNKAIEDRDQGAEEDETAYAFSNAEAQLRLANELQPGDARIRELLHNTLMADAAHRLRILPKPFQSSHPDLAADLDVIRQNDLDWYGVVSEDTRDLLDQFAALEDERKRAIQKNLDDAAEQRRKDRATTAALNSLTSDLRDVRPENAAGKLPLGLPEPPPPWKREYIPSGNGLIGGTTWIAGYNAPRNATPAVRAQAERMLAQQARLAGIPYDSAVDFKRYDFVLGIAASTNTVIDLAKRVLFDELSNGKASTYMQTAYSSLKGHSFDELACHSNGAMVCLAALENEDVRADRVVLYGPQITFESVRMWQQLVETGRVKSVQIYINKNDPVPPFSMAFGGGVLNTAIGAMPLLNLGIMSGVLHELAPSIGVKTFSCGGLVPTLDCHDMRVYKEDRTRNQ